MMRNLEPGRGGALVGATNALSSTPRTPRTPSTPSRTDDGGSRTLSTNLGSQWAPCSIGVGTRGSDEETAAALGREGLITSLASHLVAYTGVARRTTPRVLDHDQPSRGPRPRKMASRGGAPRERSGQPVKCLWPQATPTSYRQSSPLLIWGRSGF